jgi:hypothetical protein
MRRLFSLVLSAALLAALPVPTRAADTVDGFIDSLQRTLTRSSSLTARASCRTYAGGVLLPRRMTGIVTICDGASPFFLATMSVEDAGREGSPVTHSVLVAEMDDAVAVADGATGCFYRERMARTGAHLLSARLDVVFLFLRYPQLFDSFRGASGTVADEVYGSVPARRMVADDGTRHLEVVVDAVTGFPLRIDRTRIDPDRPGTRTVLELSEYRVSFLAPAGKSSLFDVNALFRGYPERALRSHGAPFPPASFGMVLRMLDGSGRTKLSDLAGKWVSSVSIREDSEIRQDRGGDIHGKSGGILSAAGGGVFLDVYRAAGTSSAGVYKPAFAARAGDLPARLGLDRTGLPSILVIGPDGSVREELVGYLPSVTEKELDAVIANALTAVPAE